MLVLTRKPGESLIISANQFAEFSNAETITVKVLEVKGKQVRLGIKAPSDVTVHREEIQKRVDAGVAKPEAVDSMKLLPEKTDNE